MRSILVRFGGTWDEVNCVYRGGKVKGRLLQPTPTFAKLKEAVYIVSRIPPT